jgi:hypothetical protein
MASEKVFPGAEFKTHMPFFDGRTLLFCRSDESVKREFLCGGSVWKRIHNDPLLRQNLRDVRQSRTITYRAWKLNYCSWNDRRPRRLDTGLPPEAVECSAAFYRKNRACFVSFIAGVPDRHRLRYHLYSMSGPSLNRMSSAVLVVEEPTRLGFVSPRFICVGSGRRLVLTDRASRERFALEFPVEKMLRATFCPDHLNRLLISGADDDGRLHTLLYDVDCETLHEVRAPGPVYKASLFGDRIVFAEKSALGFENRELRHGPFELVRHEGEVRRRTL